ncbi:unnamed protein product, partial [Scytosiphon promiscuus]
QQRRRQPQQQGRQSAAAPAGGGSGAGTAVAEANGRRRRFVTWLIISVAMFLFIASLGYVVQVKEEEAARKRHEAQSSLWRSGSRLSRLEKERIEFLGVSIFSVKSASTAAGDKARDGPLPPSALNDFIADLPRDLPSLVACLKAALRKSLAAAGSSKDFLAGHLSSALSRAWAFLVDLWKRRILPFLRRLLALAVRAPGYLRDQLLALAAAVHASVLRPCWALVSSVGRFVGAW